MKIWGDNMFVLYSGGSCDIYDLRNKSLISSFRLVSAGGSHCNCANFSVEQGPQASFPLLYVSNGQAKSPSETHCFVQSITQESDSVFSAKQVQVIMFDKDELAEAGFVRSEACPQWLVDKERKLL